MTPLQPTGRTKDPEVREPTFPPLSSDEYEPLNAHLTEGDWPELSELGEWDPTDPNLDPYEWRMELGV